MERRRYTIYVQECFYGLATAVYDWVAESGKLETSEPCFGKKSLAWSWKDRSETVGGNEERSIVVIADKETILLCPLQLALEMRPHTPWTDQRADEFLTYTVEKESMEDRRESIRSARKVENCVKMVAKDTFLRQRMKQKLSGMIEVWKRAARERLFALLGYNLIARRARAAAGTEPAKEL